MFLRLSRVTLLVLSTLAVVLTTVIGAPGAVLCIAPDHTAIEAAHAGDDYSCLGSPVRRAESSVGRKADSKGCGSCLDISLGSSAAFQIAPARQSGLFKVFVSAITANDHLDVTSAFALPISGRFGKSPDNVLRKVSTTILRI